MRLKHNELAPLSGLEKNRKYKIIWRIQKHIRKEKLHRNASLYFAKYEPYFKNLILDVDGVLKEESGLV